MEMISINGARIIRQEKDVADQILVFFDNGYGVSIIWGPYAYGGEKGLFELAVIVGDESSYDLCYDTPVTSDVIGWLTIEQATEIALQVQQLPKRAG